ncbi:hypothetical protein SASPL_114652 [Salvia splendens]|uniref:Uncharacterized protein n=1 Tax=Salvia splendens TaxID=180675 RepID=A0A8X8Y564_SALSN|nr:hypothetical protein SASPL_114652 [Salvia splendens]
MRRRAGKQHLLRKKNTKRRLRLSKSLLLRGWRAGRNGEVAVVHRFCIVKWVFGFDIDLLARRNIQVDRSDYDNVIGALPYLKVNRAN